jgi:hypothetical protein
MDARATEGALVCQAETAGTDFVAWVLVQGREYSFKVSNHGSCCPVQRLATLWPPGAATAIAATPKSLTAQVLR